MNIALSHCPNDTFIFYAWINGKLGSQVSAQFADLIELNTWALEKKFPLIKISFATYPLIQADYWILPIGAALGFGCGPKIVARKHMPLSEIKTLAVPGKLTTANWLIDHLMQLPAQRLYHRYDTICSRVQNGECDAGIVIHETRFTFDQLGLVELVDLGELWESRTDLPLPLGGLAMRRDVAAPETLLLHLRSSIRYALEHPEETLSFMLQHAQEKDEHVIQRHVQTYVNSESLRLSSEGLRALEILFGSPKEKWLFHDTLPICANC